MNQDTVPTIMSDLLQACHDAFAPVDAPIRPSREFRTIGQPMWMGEQLTVALQNLQIGGPFPLSKVRAPRGHVVPQVLLNVEVIRSCWPTVDSSGANASFPPPDSLTAAADAISADISTVWSHVVPLGLSGQLFPSLPTIGVADDVTFGQLVPVGPQGTLAGFRWGISVKVSTP